MIYTNPIALRFCTHSKIIQMYVNNTTNTLFCSFLFVGVFLQAKIGISNAWGMYQLSNHPTSKISINSFWMKICLWVFKIWRFEGGIRISKAWGPLNSTGAGLWNHQTSKININSFWMKISLWVFKIWGFEGGIRVPKHGGPLNSTRVGLLNHQTSKNSINSFWMKISLWMFKIQGFEGGIAVSKRGGPLNSTGAGLLNHQTSKFSLFRLMNQNLLMRVLNFRFRRGNWAPNVWGTLELHRGLDFKSPNIYI
jgi:hypothetical protein